jgi:hypothetical protein
MLVKNMLEHVNDDEVIKVNEYTSLEFAVNLLQYNRGAEVGFGGGHIIEEERVSRDKGGARGGGDEAPELDEHGQGPLEGERDQHVDGRRTGGARSQPESPR